MLLLRCQQGLLSFPLRKTLSQTEFPVLQALKEVPGLCVSPQPGFLPVSLRKQEINGWPGDWMGVVQPEWWRSNFKLGLVELEMKKGWKRDERKGIHIRIFYFWFVFWVVWGFFIILLPVQENPEVNINKLKSSWRPTFILCCDMNIWPSKKKTKDHSTGAIRVCHREINPLKLRQRNQEPKELLTI